MTNEETAKKAAHWWFHEFDEPTGNPSLDEYSLAQGIQKILDTRAEELSDYKNKYEQILVKCRNSKGPCFCGVHISQTME